ncbi:unnamed protein product [Adineta steineri]|uniref:Uncharacterized protein n=1 Tax=Adineta steineri TaxID=433720 RepID=A0A819WMY3_9BILA|nr:unnamed protein product [Adineta steineri]CAF1050379.1 unnamed protein product [Adineta steineri]CAF4127246.1 unnamed protein product [Adineta steineri]
MSVLIVPAIGILGTAAGTALQAAKLHLGNSHKTSLEIHNDTNGEIKIKISEIDNHDWDGNSRPDHNFNDAVIPPRSSKEEREEINAKSSTAMSKMTIEQDGKDQFSMRVNQWDAMPDDEESKDFDMENEYKVQLKGGKGTLVISISNKRDS